MGSMVFQLPGTVSPEAEADLERACVAGGQDGMPFHTHVNLEPGLLFVERTVHESGFVSVPWDVDGVGRLMLNSATLMERRNPYDLLLELGRGKIHQLRNQMCEWVGGGLILPEHVQKLVHDATHAFGRSASAANGDDALRRQVLALGHEAAQKLVQCYIDQVFQVRHLRQSKLDTQWGCQLHAVPATDDEAKLLQATFTAVTLPVSWTDIQPDENAWNWDEMDRRVAWAKDRFTVSGGPLIDFSGRCLPPWLWSHERDLNEMFDCMSAFIGTAVKRYQGSIRQWRLTSATNWSGVLASNDEELIWLAVRLVEVARKIDPQFSLAIGLCQPWGEYLAAEEHTVSPFGFADTLIRTGSKIESLDLEMIMGILPRGSYCRDTLELSRLLDLYVLLGVPMGVTLGYPSAQLPPDDKGNGDLKPRGGHWSTGYTADAQADWARTFGSLVLCKPYIQNVTWAHWDDRAPHQFPYCGLIGGDGKPKPALDALRQLRVEHLKTS